VIPLPLVFMKTKVNWFAPLAYASARMSPA
jgi:hypothetical protein